ncbi:MAG: hypothetical protein GY849_02655 [Deltaproteobacteria bacterium]|nr:hypothetical protein [Deltaproteobacteria bacterium]
MDTVLDIDFEKLIQNTINAIDDGKIKEKDVANKISELNSFFDSRGKNKHFLDVLKTNILNYFLSFSSVQLAELGFEIKNRNSYIMPKNSLEYNNLVEKEKQAKKEKNNFKEILKKAYFDWQKEPEKYEIVDGDLCEVEGGGTIPLISIKSSTFYKRI